MGGRGYAGWSWVKWGKWDNCNSIINKYILKREKKNWYVCVSLSLLLSLKSINNFFKKRTEVYFLTVLEVISSRSNVSFLWGSVFGLEMVVMSLCIHMGFHLCMFCVCLNLLFLLEQQSYGIRAHPYDFILIYLFKYPISKYSHFLRSWGLAFQHMNLGVGRYSTAHNNSQQ